MSVFCFSLESMALTFDLYAPSHPPTLPESSPLSSTSVPHIIPILSLLERGMALGETLEPWESAEVGVDVVMHHLEAARSIAHHGGMFRSNAETKLQGELDLDVESAAGFLLTHKFLRK